MLADRRASMAGLLGGLALTGTYFLLPHGGVVQVALMTTLLFSATGMLWARLRREALTRTRPWCYLLAGMVLYGATSVFWNLPAVADLSLPFPSPVDLAYFISYGLFGAFLLGLLRRRYQDEHSHREAVLAVVDAGIFACAGMGVLWPTLIAPQLAEPSMRLLAVAAAVAYPLLLAVLLGVAIRLTASGFGGGTEEALVLLWIGGELASDIFYGYLSAAGDFVYGHPLSVGWLLSYTALAALAMHPHFARREPIGTQSPPQFTGLRLWLLMSALLAPVAMVLVQDPGGIAPRGLRFFAVLAVALFFIRLQLVVTDQLDQRKLAQQLRRATHELEHQSLHDPLTGLGNRRMLLDRLTHVLRQRPRGPTQRSAVLLLDLDGFKAVNDTRGHHFGDAVLIEVAHRLSSTLRPGDTLARLGGDEFAVIVEHVRSTHAGLAAARILEALQPPITVNGDQISVPASIGIYLAEPDSDVNECLQKADLAMYAAKEAGGNRFEFFKPAMRRAGLARRQFDKEVRVAADHGQLHLVYQPIFQLRTGSAVGVEALLRWDHPDRGMLLPEAFVDAAEANGAMMQIGRWVLQQSCLQAARWSAEEQPPAGFYVAVNVSRRQLLEHDIVEMVAMAIEQAGIPAHRLQLEVTERALTSDNYQLVATLSDLRALGVAVAMDDFGTGHSSIAQLRNLPIDVLKIDQSLISRIDQQPEDYAIAAAMARLASGLGKTTVAEGVESEAQLGHLREMGIDHVQGYLLARPMGAAAAIATVRGATATSNGL